MAEGFAKHILEGDHHLIDSAGVQADGLNELAIKVMAEVGINITSQTSKKISSLDLNKFELIVTVCDHARDSCPAVNNKQFLHKSVEDPAVSRGTISEQLLIYRKVRDEIGEMVLELLKNYNYTCQGLS